MSETPLPPEDSPASKRDHGHADRRSARSHRHSRFAKEIDPAGSQSRQPFDTADLSPSRLPSAGTPMPRPPGLVAPGLSELGPSGLRSSSSVRTPIHPLELALLWLVSVHLVFLPWAIGDMHPWAQITSGILSVLGFGVALWPRNYSAEHTGGPSFRLWPWPKLIKFPIFWLGLALLGLVLTQALNPSWEWHTNGKTWWMQAIPHLTWLPHGVRVPWAWWSPWRNLMIYSTAFLTVCSIWVGFTRRRTVQRFFLVLAANGVALSLFGLVQRIFGNGKLFWLWDSANASFFSSFVYKNHAGAYLFLTLAIICGLAAWYFMRGARRLEKSNPSGVFAFLATCIAVSILVSYARGATLVTLIYLCLVVVGFLYHQWRLPQAARQPVITVALVLVFGLFLRTGMQTMESGLAWDRLREAVSGDDLSVEARQTTYHAAGEMLRDHWGVGVGSAGFEFLFPIYQQHYPQLAGGLWRHAHNDWLEFPIELGVPGMVLILAGFVSWAFVLIRSFAWQNPLSASIVLGLLFLLGMSLGDFMLQNPAILITWCALWPASTLWARLEEQRVRT